MALTRALAANNEIVTNTEKTVTSALSINVVTILPAIDNGGGATVAAGYSVLFVNNGTGWIEVRDQYGHRVTIVLPGKSTAIYAIGTLAANVWASVEEVKEWSLAASQVLVVGAGAALAFTANTNAAITTPGSVWKYLKLILDDGTAIFIPAWK